MDLLQKKLKKDGTPKKVGRPKKTPVENVRLQPLEQVRDRISDETSYSATRKAYFEPINSLSDATKRDLLLASIWVDNCVQVIVDEVIKYDLVAIGENANKINAFLKYPSSVEPLMMVRKKYLKDMLRWGNGGCAIAYKNGVPNNLVVVPGYSIRVLDTNPPQYTFKDIGDTSTFYKNKNDNSVILKLREFMHFQFEADSDRTQARSALERAYNTILCDKYLTNELMKFLQHGFYKFSFVKSPGAGETEMLALSEFMSTQIDEGSKVIGVNKEGAACTEIPAWDANDVVKVHQWVALSIANVFKVPPFMLNLVADVGSLNAREQKARFLENVIEPLVMYESFIYTLILAKMGFKEANVEIKAPLIGTRTRYDKARIAQILVGTNIISIEEARSDLGYQN